MDKEEIIRVATEDKIRADRNAKLLHKAIEDNRTIVEGKDKEIERLNNIINELEKWLYEKANTETESEKNGYFNPSILRERATLNLVYYYLQELKGSDDD